MVILSSLLESLSIYGRWLFIVVVLGSFYTVTKSLVSSNKIRSKQEPQQLLCKQ